MLGRMGASQDNWVEEAALAAYGPTATWLTANAAQLPDEVRETLRLALRLGQSVAELKQQARGRFRELMRALRVLPSSEKRASRKKATASPADPLARLRARCAEAERLGGWHGRLAKWHRAVKRALSRKLKEAEAMQFDPQEEAEIAAEAQAKTEASLERIGLGDGPDPALGAPAEALMRGATTRVAHDSVSCPVEDEDLPRGAVAGQRFVQERQRIDFSFQVTVLDVEVEKKAVRTADGEQRLVAGSLNSVGPAKMRVTWNFLAHMAMLLSQYAMPMHRFARLVSTSAKRFTAAETSRHYHFMARHFAPIYNHLGISLAQAPLLSGDDTRKPRPAGEPPPDSRRRQPSAVAKLRHAGQSPHGAAQREPRLHARQRVASRLAAQGRQRR